MIYNLHQLLAYSHGFSHQLIAMPQHFATPHDMHTWLGPRNSTGETTEEACIPVGDTTTLLAFNDTLAAGKL